MPKKLRLAMIGAGSRANAVIYPAFNSLPDVEFVGICDIDLERLNKTADKYNIQNRYGKEGVNDYKRMIAEQKPDAVAVIGQPHIMYDIWLWCLEQGLNLYIEKPFAMTIHQARILENVAKKNNCITQVSYQRRYTPMVTMLHEKCLERGPIVHAVCKFYKNEITDFTRARDHMFDDCVHAIDSLRYLCGGEVVKIDSHVKNIRTTDINFISATLHFDNGANGYILNSWSSGKRIFSVEIHAPGIFVEAEHEDKAFLYADGDVKGVMYDTREVSGSEDNYVFTGVKAAAADFVNGCLTGKQPACNFSDAIKTTEIAEIILAQGLLSGR